MSQGLHRGCRVTGGCQLNLFQEPSQSRPYVHSTHHQQAPPGVWVIGDEAENTITQNTFSLCRPRACFSL